MKFFAEKAKQCEANMENKDITYPNGNAEATYTTGSGRASEEERKATP